MEENSCKNRESVKIPDSTQTFPDKANYRIEVSGIETAEILEAVVDEAKKFGIPIHRAIATVQGSRFYSDEQLKKLAKAAAKHKVEVIICPDSLAKAVIDDPNKIFTWLNWQSNEEMLKYIDEIIRCIKIGFRGFLVWRKGMLTKLNYLRQYGHLPRWTIFKVSTFDNNSNAFDFSLAGSTGADTINAANGLTLENLKYIRVSVSTPIDMHITFWQLSFEKNEQGKLELAVKPYDRINDAPEIARIVSPVYFKFEAGTPGIGVYNMTDDWTFEKLAEHKRKDVRVAAEIVKTIKEKYPRLKLSGWGPRDLRVPGRRVFF